MHDVIETSDFATTLLGIEELRNEITNSCRVIDDGLRAIKVIENMTKINTLSIENKTINEDLLNTTLSTLNTSLESIGCGELILGESLSLEDNVNNLNITLEGIAGDIWLAIKKIFEKIAKAMGSFYESIRTFFGATKVKAAETKSKLDELPDLNDFEIEKNTLSKFVDQVKKSLPLFSVMGLDLLSEADFNKYNDCVLIGNRWILENTALLIKGSSSDKPNELQASDKLRLVSNAAPKAFQNVRGIIEKKYTEKVNSHYLVSMKHNGATIVTILKDKSVTKLVHSPLTIDNKNLDTLYRKSLSKLNKNKVHAILEMIGKYNEEIDKFKKDSESFQEKLSLEFKDLANKQLGSEAIFVTNTNTAGNIMSGIAESLVKHVAVYQMLSDKLTNIYAVEAKKVSK